MSLQDISTNFVKYFSQISVWFINKQMSFLFILIWFFNLIIVICSLIVKARELFFQPPIKQPDKWQLGSMRQHNLSPLTVYLHRVWNVILPFAAVTHTELHQLILSQVGIARCYLFSSSRREYWSEIH